MRFRYQHYWVMDAINSSPGNFVLRETSIFLIMIIPTIELVKTLIRQFNRFIELSATFGPELQGPDLTFSVSISYSTLSLSINRSEVLYFEYTHQQEGTSGPARSECYYHDQQKIEILKKHFASLIASSAGTVDMDTSGNVKYTEELTRYLTMAESIAACTYLCAAGDDYRPGYFSEIIVQADGILLKQINHMNSKSLNHKEDYSLRDLEFSIPLQPSAKQRVSVTMDDDYIGIMRIRFSDRSSQNNKICGEKIREKIAEEKLNFSK